MIHTGPMPVREQRDGLPPRFEGAELTKPDTPGGRARLSSGPHPAQNFRLTEAMNLARGMESRATKTKENTTNLNLRQEKVSEMACTIDRVERCARKGEREGYGEHQHRGGLPQHDMREKSEERDRRPLGPQRM